MQTTSLAHRPALRTDRLAVAGRHGPLLEPTSLSVDLGACLLVSGDPGHGHTALALALAGRLVPDAGHVLLDGQPDPDALQRAVALVDTPGVTEPDDVLPLRTVVGEGLAMADRPAGRAAVREFLIGRGHLDLASRRLDQVPAAVRVRLLTELAAARPGVRVLVLTLPDRHGGPPSWWWQVAQDVCAAGELTVVVTCTPSSAQILGVEHATLGDLA